MNFGVGLFNDHTFDLIKTDMLLARNSSYITMGPIRSTNVTADYIKTSSVAIQSQVPILVGTGFTTVTVSAAEMDRPVIITSTATLPADFALILPNVTDVLVQLTTANTNLALQYGDSITLSVVNLNTNAGHAAFANPLGLDVLVPPQVTTANVILPNTITDFTYIIDPTATPASSIVVANLSFSKAYVDASVVTSHTALSNIGVLSHTQVDGSLGTAPQVLSTSGTPSFASLITSGSIGSTGIMRVYNTTLSTSSTSGALVVSGGMGLAENAYIGGIMSVAGNTFFQAIEAAGVIVSTNTVDGTNTSGSFLLSGGMNLAKSLYTGQSLEAANSIASTGIMRVYATTTSTSMTTGALVVTGGIATSERLSCSTLSVGSGATFAGAASVGGNASVVGTLAVSGISHLYATTNSTSVSSGGLIVDGGAGILQDVYIGGGVYGGMSLWSTAGTWNYSAVIADTWHTNAQNVYVEKIGNLATMFWSAWSAASSGTAVAARLYFAFGVMPAAFRPRYDVQFVVRTDYNGDATGTLGLVYITAGAVSGGMQFTLGPPRINIPANTTINFPAAVSVSYIV